MPTPQKTHGNVVLSDLAGPNLKATIVCTQFATDDFAQANDL